MGPELEQGQFTVGGCAIRFDEVSGMPKVHANNVHFCAGVSSVGIDARTGFLEIKLSASRPIVSFYTSPDETLTERGIIAGGSGGVNRILVNFYDSQNAKPLDLNVPADRMRLAGKTSNLWVGWVHVKR